jgi:hypothetical protein
MRLTTTLQAVDPDEIAAAPLRYISLSMQRVS